MADTKLVTVSEYPFLQVRFDRDNLFAVRPGMQVDDVLQQASDYLEAAHALANESADELGLSGYASVYLIEIAKGLVDAAICAVTDAEASHG